MRNFMSSVNEKLGEVKKIGEMNELIKDLKQTVDFMSDKYDEVLTKLKEMEAGKRVGIHVTGQKVSSQCHLMHQTKYPHSIHDLT